MKIRMRNPEFPLYFIGELGFGIFLFLDSPYKVISLKEKCIMILICVTIWNIVFMISRMRIIIMDKNGCTVKLLLWKKTYKWEDLEIIREDCWNSGRLHLKGIVFSSRRMGKNGKVYSTKKIFQSLQFLNCFFIIFDDEDVERIYALKKKLGKVPEFKKTSENILTQLKDWGVKVEKGEKPVEAAIRECHEELGNKAIFDENLFELIMEFDEIATSDGKTPIHFYVFKYKGKINGELTTSKEIEKFKWYTTNEGTDILSNTLKNEVVPYCLENNLID